MSKYLKRAAPPRWLSVLPCVMSMLLSVACSQTPAPVSTAPPTGIAPATTAADRHDIAQRDDVESTVHYPSLRPELAPLEQAMHAYADAQKTQLVAQMKKVAPAAERQEKPGRLDLDFTVATQTQEFVSAIGEGEGDFGGAHPQSLRATFTQHLPSGKVVALTDLFSDPQAAIKIFSVEAIRRFEADFESKLRGENLPDKAFTDRLKSIHELVEQGAAPKAENFSAFLVDGVDGKAIGITLVFPAAQVASYADGPQQVEVPVKLFYDGIKPEYRTAFDREDSKAAEPTTGSR